MNNATAVAAPPRHSFFGATGWKTFGIAFALALGVYVHTLAPTVTLEDSGELVVAADHAGVPHPPGYPVWTMISWAFARVFSFVRFRGQPNPAWAVNLVSAVFGALAVGLFAMLIARSGRDILRHVFPANASAEPDADNGNARRHGFLCGAAGISAALLFAFTHAMWSQSVIAEIYTLNAFFLALIFLLTYQWMFEPTDKHLYLTAFVFGLSLANYYALLLIITPLTIIVLLNDTKLFRDFAIAGIPYAILLGLAYIGRVAEVEPQAEMKLSEILRALFVERQVPPITHPTHMVFHFYLFLNFLILTLAWFFLPRGKTVAISIALAQLGFAFYIYMPLASEFRNPPMNWGYPRTWQGFLHAVSRGQYERFEPVNIFSLRFIDQLGDYFSDLRLQFTLPLALLGFLPFTAWKLRAGNRSLHIFPVAATLACAGALVGIAETYLLAPFLTGPPPGIYKWFLLPVLILALLGGMLLLIGQAGGLLDIVRGRKRATLSERLVLAAVFPIAAFGYLYYLAQLTKNIVSVTEPFRTAGHVFESGEAMEIVLQTMGIFSIMLLPVVLAVLIVFLMKSQFEMKLILNDTAQRWIIAILAGFMAMSVIMIVMANPKGDIQDSFIQKVKFISSHALYALWIGYGLILALSYIAQKFGRHSGLPQAALALTLLLPLAPVWHNATNEHLIKVYGGADQHGQDFGWQFGNYQLRGAEAILEELCPDEEPPPNPEFPEAMTQDAIFFGGTDPGRFVPTYMIYSARVREDVYLITQNALADNTYMAVMRDLYGDRIWIPSERDSALAFQRFVDDIQSGRRPKPPHADLKFEDGRVQITGALGVMEINGILTEAIFQRNRFRHDFYIEESYVIRWMYPFLSPHGLIMKINSDPTPLTPDIVAADRDFWDWYARRLLARDDFLRDVAARKSFSKLRSAIAGLYAARNMLRDAEAAFQEARLLYPLSPEANFRIVQEVFLRQNRFAEALHVLETLFEEDFRNKRIPPLIAQVSRMQTMTERIAQYENKLRTKKAIDPNELLQLSRLYLDAGRQEAFLRLGEQILRNTDIPSVIHFRLAQMYSGLRRTNEMIRALELGRRDMPDNLRPEIYMEITRMYGQARKTEKMAEALDMYLRVKPDDYLARLDQATLRIQRKAPAEDVRESLRLAIAHGGRKAAELIAGNPLFAPYREGLAPAAPAPSTRAPLPGFPGTGAPPPGVFRPAPAP